MATYVILSKLSHDAASDPKSFADVARTVAEKIKAECPNVNWKESYGTSGRFDVIDIVESPDIGGIQKAVMIIRAYGRATTETMLATPWHEFVSNVSGRN